METAIHVEGSCSLAAGERVRFDVVQGPKGAQAANVRRSETVGRLIQ